MKKKRFKDVRAHDYPLFFIKSPIYLRLASTITVKKDSNRNITFLAHCSAMDKVFEVAREVGAPIEWRNTHYYIFFKGTWRILTRRSFKQFIEKCEEIMGIAQ